MSVVEPRERDPNYTLAMFFRFRWEGVSEEKIAEKLLFDSAEDMRKQLRGWGMPDWVVGAETNSSKNRSRKKKTPRLRAVGPRKELPPPGNATELFKERIEALLKSVELLKHIDEGLYGRYFARQDVETATVLRPWKHMSEEERKAIREERGPDFEEDFAEPNAVAILPGGVALSPSETVAMLIGVYALADGDMDTLIDVLHKDRYSAGAETREEVRQHVEGARADNDKIDGLKGLTRRLSAWVRGSNVRPGRPPELPKADHAFACAITYYRNQGLTDEQIARKESHRKKEDGTSYTIKDVTELGDLGLSWP